MENRFPLVGMENLFQNTCILDEKTAYINWISTSRKKSQNKRVLFQVNTKSVSISRNGEFVSEYVSTRRKNCSIKVDGFH